MFVRSRVGTNSELCIVLDVKWGMGRSGDMYVDVCRYIYIYACINMNSLSLICNLNTYKYIYVQL
jgi:hypothetical protein